VTKMIAEVEKSTRITNENICEMIREIRESVYQNILRDAIYKEQGLTKSDLELEMFVVSFADNRINPFHIITGVELPINLSGISAVPENFQEISNYIGIDTRSLTEGKAIKAGEVILRQAVFSNYSIGPPEYHGYDLIKVTKDGKFSFSKEKATIRKVDPSNLLSYINSKFEKLEEKTI